MSNGLLDKNFESYLDAYSEYLLRHRGLSDATVRTYAQDLNTFVHFLMTLKIHKFRDVLDFRQNFKNRRTANKDLNATGQKLNHGSQ